MAKQNWDKVQEATTPFGGTIVVNKTNGRTKHLLTPSGRAQKYAAELQQGVRLTNGGAVKVTEQGTPIPLTEGQIAYRKGYIGSTLDNGSAFKAKHPRYKRKTNTSLVGRK